MHCLFGSGVTLEQGWCCQPCSVWLCMTLQAPSARERRQSSMKSMRAAVWLQAVLNRSLLIFGCERQGRTKHLRTAMVLGCPHVRLQAVLNRSLLIFRGQRQRRAKHACTVMLLLLVWLHCFRCTMAHFLGLLGGLREQALNSDDPSSSSSLLTDEDLTAGSGSSSDDSSASSDIWPEANSEGAFRETAAT